jgi:hypothetical protein
MSIPEKNLTFRLNVAYIWVMLKVTRNPGESSESSRFTAPNRPPFMIADELREGVRSSVQFASSPFGDAGLIIRYDCPPEELQDVPLLGARTEEGKRGRLVQGLRHREALELNIQSPFGSMLTVRAEQITPSLKLEEDSPGILSRLDKNQLTGWMNFRVGIDRLCFPEHVLVPFAEILMLRGEMPTIGNSDAQYRRLTREIESVCRRFELSDYDKAGIAHTLSGATTAWQNAMLVN